ncbi:hypothetical protein B0H15DRAFT_840904 [Mycena belliarum]|uniref:Uncharacterized protein n=1 Tax=Mycena belliarum TaxID=1033014 RepID=A0AAD6XUP1_9AGAR|nr:hypothetical protein B0H15DRAFT_840904 [Mycena belliae]
MAKRRGSDPVLELLLCLTIMPRARILILGAFPIAFAGLSHYYYRRLLVAYPTHRIPPPMEVSARRDTPAFGILGSGKEAWKIPHAGDMWTATVPRRLLAPKSPGTDSELLAFARAFWSTWPLQIERRVMHLLALLWPFEMFQTHRGGEVGRNGEHNFVDTAPILDGLFVVEAQTPLIVSWWFKSKPRKSFSDRTGVGMLGGYHSFAVEDSGSADGDEEPNARLCFVSHLVLSAAPPADGLSVPTHDLQGFSLVQRLAIHFHVFYSRILLDQAVRALKRGAV